MSELQYRPYAQRGALDLDECVIVPTVAGDMKSGWVLMFYVRTTDGHAQHFRAPVNPNGGPIESGPLGRTWGLTRCGPNEWEVSPSIDFGNWHQTPKLVDVPDGEPWQAS